MAVSSSIDREWYGGNSLLSSFVTLLTCGIQGHSGVYNHLAMAATNSSVSAMCLSAKKAVSLSQLITMRRFETRNRSTLLPRPIPHLQFVTNPKSKKSRNPEVKLDEKIRRTQ